MTPGRDFGGVTLRIHVEKQLEIQDEERKRPVAQATKAETEINVDE